MQEYGALIGQGRTASIYAYEPGKILKLFQSGYEKLAQEEYGKHMLVQNAGVKIPKLYDMYRQDNRAGLVYQRLNGRNMAPLLLESGADISDLIDMLAQLHLSVARCKASAKLQSVHERIQSHINATGDLTDPIKQKLLNLLKTMPEGDRLCHGDFHPGNIILEDGDAYIIDWLTACRGCFAADVARTIVIIKYGILSSNVPEEVCRLASGLCDMYLDQLVSMGAVTYDEVHRWLPLQIAARLIEGNSEREQKALLDKLAILITR